MHGSQVTRNVVAGSSGPMPEYATESHARWLMLYAMRLRRLFTEHPASVGETYFEHLCTATGFALQMVLGGVACLVHALLPFLFQRTGSECIEHLYDRMVLNRRARASRTGRPGAALR